MWRGSICRGHTVYRYLFQFSCAFYYSNQEGMEPRSARNLGPGQSVPRVGGLLLFHLSALSLSLSRSSCRRHCSNSCGNDGQLYATVIHEFQAMSHHNNVLTPIGCTNAALMASLSWFNVHPYSLGRIGFFHYSTCPEVVSGIQSSPDNPCQYVLF